MHYLLFIDDDRNLLRINRTYFERRDYQVFTAENQPQAAALLKSQPIDCVILDILIPETDGYLLCEWIKNEISAPVIFLTCLTEKDCMYRGFDLGADDYMTKPYELKELEFRIKARINQNKGVAGRKNILSFPPLSIDVAGRRASIGQNPLGLTAYEFDILLLLVRSPGKVFSQDAIYREVWKLPDLNNAQTVRVHLAHMRHKLEQACPEYQFIRLAWGKGFSFQYDKKETT